MLRFLLWFLALVAVKVLGLQAPLPGYTVEDITWTIDVWGNGTMVNITGPVQHVVAEINKINPDLLKNLNVTQPPSSSTKSNIVLPQDLQQGIRCGESLDPKNNWDPAETLIIYEGVYYLRGVPGKPANGPGPGACGRVSCSYKNAIWWCNDKKQTQTLNSFGVIADCAKSLCDKCDTNTFNPPVHTCYGQNFMPNDWNCIVTWDGNNC
ncbi:hypothetical protein V8F20_010229 [Naviculisporaceae sp. PSN 640]